MVLQWFLVGQTIGSNGFAMVFVLVTFAPGGFSMLALNHWSNDGIVTIHRYGLIHEILRFFFPLQESLISLAASWSQKCGIIRNVFLQISVYFY